MGSPARYMSPTGARTRAFQAAYPPKEMLVIRKKIGESQASY